MNSSLIKDAGIGALGGIAGTLIMGKLSTYLYKFESEERKKEEENLRSAPPYQVMAEKIVKKTTGKELANAQKMKVGKALHWGYGLAWGALYGVLRTRVPLVAKVGGLPFATAFFLTGDEAMNGIMKTTGPLKRFPWEAHARGFVNHVAFTATTDGIHRGLSKMI
jgi:uncharacterized membrane protein YagU involved in acid resistance